MSDHAELIRRTVRVMDDILAGEYGTQNVDLTAVKVEFSRDPDDGTERYPVVMRCEDGSLAAMLSVASSLSGGMEIAAVVRDAINDWLDNDIAREMQ